MLPCPLTENDIKLYFRWLFLTMKIYIVIPIDQYNHRNFKLTTGTKSI